LVNCRFGGLLQAHLADEVVRRPAINSNTFNFARLFALLTAMRIIFPKKVGVPTRNWIILSNFAPVKNVCNE
jgi:hypothetical protein